ncbi:MAG: hypothetical protein LAO55_16460 [Acidobacteriia bacterium]|nr:hypothetical protein [Terriglobia bacterium]
MRIVPQLDAYPRLVSFGQTALGKAVLLGAFAGGLFFNRLDSWIEITAAVAAMTYFPARRRRLVSMAALYWLVFHSTWLNWAFLRELATAAGQKTDWTLTVLLSGILAAVFCVLAVFFRYVRARRVSLAAKRPVLCLMAGYALMLAAGALLPLGGMTRLLVWSVIAVTAPYLWFFAYALKDASARTPDDAVLQFGTLQPFWGSPNVPVPKGAANLRNIEARNPEDLSITQLKAIKLLIWVFTLQVLQQGLLLFVHGAPGELVLRLIGLLHWTVPNLGVPTLETSLQRAVVPVHIAWASLIAHFAQALLSAAVGPNLVIACCRMAGFNALRNSYRPLQALTVAEFWNRYNYYFKEVLVDFFFFPVFTRYFKQYRRLRLFAATMAAATVGNMIYHFSLDYRSVAQMGLWRALVGFQVYSFYSTVLGLGIGISQLRGHGGQRARGDASRWRRALATVGVLLFFCLLEVFDQEGRSVGLGRYGRFFLRLFSIPV